MAGTISSTYIGKGNMRATGFSPILYNSYQTREIMEKDESYVIDRNKYVNEREGYERVMNNITFETQKIPERKPQHFYAQQPHILRHIPPMYNDIYKLDTDDVTINSRYLPGKSDHLKTENYLLRDERLIDTSELHEIRGNQNVIQQQHRPDLINPQQTKMHIQNTISAQPNMPRFDRVNKTPEIMLKDTVDYTRRYIPQSLHGNPQPIIHQNLVNVETNLIDMRGRRVNPSFNIA